MIQRLQERLVVWRAWFDRYGSLWLGWGKLRWLVTLGLPAVVAISIAAWQLWLSQAGADYRVLSSQQEHIEQASSSAVRIESDKAKVLIMVDVGGAVVNPGVKELTEGSRVVEALNQAGGFSSEADKEYVWQVLNLAQTLDDGDKLYIPTVSQVLASLPTPAPLLSKANVPVSLLSKQNSPSPSSVVSPTPTKAASTSASPTPGQSVVNVNQASESELDTLPGVGAATATKIVTGRPYLDMDSLCQVLNNSKTCSGLEGLVSF